MRWAKRKPEPVVELEPVETVPNLGAVSIPTPPTAADLEAERAERDREHYRQAAAEFRAVRGPSWVTELARIQSQPAGDEPAALPFVWNRDGRYVL